LQVPWESFCPVLRELIFEAGVPLSWGSHCLSPGYKRGNGTQLNSAYSPPPPSLSSLLLYLFLSLKHIWKMGIIGSIWYLRTWKLG
jgi:hypothetical protein